VWVIKSFLQWMRWVVCYQHHANSTQTAKPPCVSMACMRSMRSLLNNIYIYIREFSHTLPLSFFLFFIFCHANFANFANNSVFSSFYQYLTIVCVNKEDANNQIFANNYPKLSLLNLLLTFLYILAILSISNF